MARAIFGADPVSGGKVYLRGKELKIHCPQDAIRCGIGLITEDRKNQGLLLNKGIDFNTVYASMERVSHAGVIRSKEEKAMAKKYMDAMNIKAWSPSQKTGTLSGGNQQKVVLSKWLINAPTILFVDEPTKGVDVGAKAEIYGLMGDLVESGISIIMVSSDLPELLAISDRVLVVSNGKITGEFSRDNVSEEAVMRAAIK